jgi:2-polyprenyl-3-methyl-5-hydroxy-6-metoxy-1,4-benzoquinol methylase
MSLEDKIFWDLIADEFDKKIGLYGDSIRLGCVDEMLLTSLDKICCSGNTVLDAGSGNGYFIKKLKDKGFHPNGLDISPNLIKIAKNKCPQATFYEADLEDWKTLPHDKTWHAVVCSFVLDGLKKFEDVLTNIHRLLSEDGHLIINIPHPAFLMGDRKIKDRTKLYVDDDPDGQPYTMFECTKSVQYYWRPISLYINTIISAQFEIKAIIEPSPTPCDKYFQATRGMTMHAYVLGIVAQRRS